MRNKRSIAVTLLVLLLSLLVLMWFKQMVADSISWETRLPHLANKQLWDPKKDIEIKELFAIATIEAKREDSHCYITDCWLSGTVNNGAVGIQSATIVYASQFSPGITRILLHSSYHWVRFFRFEVGIRNGKRLLKRICG